MQCHLRRQTNGFNKLFVAFCLAIVILQGVRSEASGPTGKGPVSCFAYFLKKMSPKNIKKAKAEEIESRKGFVSLLDSLLSRKNRLAQQTEIAKSVLSEVHSAREAIVNQFGQQGLMGASDYLATLLQSAKPIASSPYALLIAKHRVWEAAYTEVQREIAKTKAHVADLEFRILKISESVTFNPEQMKALEVVFGSAMKNPESRAQELDQIRKAIWREIISLEVDIHAQTFRLEKLGEKAPGLDLEIQTELMLADASKRGKPQSRKAIFKLASQKYLEATRRYTEETAIEKKMSAKLNEIASEVTTIVGAEKFSKIQSAIQKNSEEVLSRNSLLDQILVARVIVWQTNLLSVQIRVQEALLSATTAEAVALHQSVDASSKKVTKSAAESGLPLELDAAQISNNLSRLEMMRRGYRTELARLRAQYKTQSEVLRKFGARGTEYETALSDDTLIAESWSLGSYQSLEEILGDFRK